MKKVSIGGGQGFWGDSPDAAIHMIREGNLDYMACDYLAELTLSIMQRQRMKNPAAGYARDFITLMKEAGREAWEKKIGVITNAGGMNITGAVDALKAVAEEQGMKGYKIGYVLGDVSSRIWTMWVISARSRTSWSTPTSTMAGSPSWTV